MAFKRQYAMPRSEVPYPSYSVALTPSAEAYKGAVVDMFSYNRSLCKAHAGIKV